MENSDLIIAYKKSDGSFNFSDRTAFDKSEPKVDKYQDWLLLFTSQIGDTTTIIFKRKIRICRNFNRS